MTKFWSGSALSKLMRALPYLVVPLAAGFPAASAQTFPAGFDLRAKDAVDVFSAQCIATRGDRTQAERLFGNGHPGVNRLPADVLAAAEEGHTGGAGWVIRSPNGAVFMLEYDPRGFCGIRLIEADETSVQVTVRALANAAAAVAKSPLTTATPVFRTENGAKITFQDYSFPVVGHIEHITLSTCDHKVGAQQHFLTLNYSKPQE